MSVWNVSLLCISELIGDTAFKFFTRTNLTQYLLGGIVAYTGVIYFLIQSLRTSNLIYVNGMWDGISAIISTTILYFLLGEKLNTSLQYAGLLMIIAGVLLLWWGGVPY